MCIAIECSYKLDHKMNLNFCVNYAHFRKSGHICITYCYRRILNLLTHAIFTVNANTAYTTVKSVDLICNGDSITASADKVITKPAEELPQ